MQVEETKLEGCFLIKPRVFEDSRGYFFESFNQKDFENAVGRKITFVQDNQAKSDYGVVRGLHYQKGAFAQAKLVRVVTGSVLDIAVDMRVNSQTYLEHIAVELNNRNHHQLFIPRGFAHGYSVLEDNTLFTYKCDNYYNKESEGGVFYADRELNIDWKIPKRDMLISEKDLQLSTL